MARTRTAEDSAHEGDVRGAAAAAPRSSPLELVEAAVAGDDLQRLARSAAEALSCPVAIVLPVFSLSAHWPPEGCEPAALAAASAYASSLAGDPDSQAPSAISDAVPVRLGHQIVGVVVAVGRAGAKPTARPWLDAAAAAATIAALMRDSAEPGDEDARRAFLRMLELHAEPELDSLLAHARRLGYDFTQGGVAVAAALEAGDEPDLRALAPFGLVASMGAGRMLGLAALGGELGDGGAAELSRRLQAAGATSVIASAPRREPAGLRAALHEAAVLLELLLAPGAMLLAYEETYRLLIGVLLRDPDELVELRDTTTGPLERYDESHDTDLISTLETFLSRHGSTTDTAEAMSLHRHTVGYRLARVQEVSGLSPYESEGRERLSLGLKAHRILLAEKRRGDRVEAS